MHCNLFFALAQCFYRLSATTHKKGFPLLSLTQIASSRPSPQGESQSEATLAAITIIAAMNEDFELPVDYKKKEILFTARLLQQGFTYKIEVEIEQAKVLFEKDDQGDWRALIDPEKDTAEKIDIELLKAIATSLEAIFE